ncbi:MAG: hypothetical protein QOK39_118 [Acidimicrobiaceae bacterium]|nr:hypothetical protein [Acidimicrobiaceae bacterium]
MARQLKGWPDGDLASPVAVAHVNHGRWLADCPFGCNSSQYAEPTDRRLFCINCANGDTMKWVPVKWPDDLEVAAVEAALSIRPDPQTRSWRPPETAGDLVAENKAKGLT